MLDQVALDVQQMCSKVTSQGFELVLLVGDRTSYDTLTFGSPLGLSYLSSNPDVVSRFTEYCNANNTGTWDYNPQSQTETSGFQNVCGDDTSHHSMVSDNTTAVTAAGNPPSMFHDQDTSQTMEVRTISGSQIIDSPTCISEETNAEFTVIEPLEKTRNCSPERHVESGLAMQDEDTDPKNAETDVTDNCKTESSEVDLSPKPSYICGVCHTVFISKRGLINHKKVHSREVKQIKRKCDTTTGCEKTPPKGRSKKEYFCDICRESFSSWYLRKNHMVTHGPKNFFCDQCDKSFHFKTELRAHCKVHETSTKLKCHICSREYNQRNRLNEHLKSHDAANYVKCEHCGKSILKKVFAKHMVIHGDEKNFNCQICGKAFISDTHLRNHFIVHDDTRKYKCKFCHASFKKSDTLKVHENAIHTKESIFICDICGIHYLRKSSLRLHQQRHVNGSYQCKCRYCQAVFRNHASLMTHVKNFHTKEDLAHEKPTLKQCKQCGKVFGQYKPYRIHLDMHAGIKRYSCSVCEKAFNSPNNLRQHRKIHDGSPTTFKCDICNAKLRNQKRLKMHMELHAEQERQNFTLGMPALYPGFTMEEQHTAVQNNLYKIETSTAVCDLTAQN